MTGFTGGQQVLHEGNVRTYFHAPIFHSFFCPLHAKRNVLLCLLKPFLMFLCALINTLRSLQDSCTCDSLTTMLQDMQER
jgi:hypothetical protein